jgi:5-methylcytosine-specific restriction endonuclease McrA
VTAAADLQFLRNLQRLLDESLFTATYKFALLHALADLSVEREADDDGRLRITVVDIAGKFIEYYWRQATPFRRGQVLQQNTMGQAAVIRDIHQAHGRYEGRLGQAMADVAGWQALRRRVAGVIREMPLWRLQTVGGITHEFLYRKDDYADGHITLLPGVARAFRNFHGLVTHLIRGAWVAQINRIRANSALIGETGDLAGFLFGTERGTLALYRNVLRDHQAGRCFYCERPVRDAGELDHFVPWARYPIDVGENFVFAHSGCNNAKRDFLAAVRHLERWHATNLDPGDSLGERLIDAGLASDRACTLMIARWAYEQGLASNAQLWVRRGEFEACDYRWRGVLG